MIVESNGKITIVGEIEESKDMFTLHEVNQIIWNNMSSTSNPKITFQFKDRRINFEIYFELE